MADKTKITYEVDFTANVSSLESSVKNLYNSIKGYKFNPVDKVEVDKAFKSVMGSFDKFSKKSKATLGSNKDASNYAKDVAEVGKEYQNFINVLKKTGVFSNKVFKDLVPKDSIQGLENADKALKQYKEDTEALVKAQKKLARDQQSLAGLKWKDVDPSTKKAHTRMQNIMGETSYSGQAVNKTNAANAAKELEQKGEIARAKELMTLSSKFTTEQLRDLSRQREAWNKKDEAVKRGKATIEDLTKAQSNSLQKFRDAVSQTKFGEFIDTSQIKNLKDAEAVLNSISDEALTELLQKLDMSEEELKSFLAEGGKIPGAFRGAEKAAQSVDKLTSKITKFFAIDNMIRLFKRAMRSAYESIKELDAAMTEQAVVTDFSVSDLWDQLPQYTKQANELGVATKESYEAATLYYQQGLKTAQVNQLTTNTLKMARIANLDAATATDRMTNALRGFNMELNETNSQRVADVYSKLAAVSATDVNELSVAMTKTASIANSANMEFENTAAYLAQMLETTRESAETAGTALKTVIGRFTEVKKLYTEGELMGSDEEGEAIDVNKVSAALRTAGIDMNKFFVGEVGLDDIFNELAKKWDSLSIVQQRYIATQAAGSRQQSRFIAMLGDYNRLTELQADAYGAAGASQEQYEKTLESLQTKLNQLKNAWNEFTMGIANSKLVKGGIDILTKILNLINKITTGFGLWDSGSILSSISKITLGIMGMSAALAGVKKALMALSGSEFFENLSKGLGLGIDRGSLEAAAGRINVPFSKDTLKAVRGSLSDVVEEFKDLSKIRAEKGIAGVLQELSPKSLEKPLKALGEKGLKGALAEIPGMAKGAFGSLGAGISSVATALTPFLPEILAVAAAIGAIVAVVKAYKATNLDEQLRRAEEAADNAASSAEKAKEKFESLLNSKKEYTTLVDGLDDLTKGTDEWTQSIMNANSQIEELLKKYKTLYQYVSMDENGLMTISDEGWETVTKEQKEASQNATATAAVARAYASAIKNNTQNVWGVSSSVKDYTGRAHEALNWDNDLIASGSLFANRFVMADIARDFRDGAITSVDEAVERFTGGLDLTTEELTNLRLVFSEMQNEISLNNLAAQKEMINSAKQYADPSMNDATAERIATALYGDTKVNRKQAKASNAYRSQQWYAGSPIGTALSIGLLSTGNRVNLGQGDGKLDNPFNNSKKELAREYAKRLGYSDLDSWLEAEGKTLKDFKKYQLRDMLGAQDIAQEQKKAMADAQKELKSLGKSGKNLLKFNLDFDYTELKDSKSTLVQGMLKQIDEAREQAQKAIDEYQLDLQKDFQGSTNEAYKFATLSSQFKEVDVALTAAVKNGTFSTVAQQIEDLGLNLSDPIQGFADLRDQVENGTPEMQRFSAIALTTSNGFFSMENQIASLGKALSKEQLQAIQDANSIYELGKSNKQVATLMEQTGASASTMARYLKGVSDGTIDATKQTKEYIAVLDRLHAAQNTIEDSLAFIKNFDAGESSDTIGSSWGSWIDQIQTLYDKGAYGDKSLQNYVKAFVGEDVWKDALTQANGDLQVAIGSLLDTINDADSNFYNAWESFAQTATGQNIVSLGGDGTVNFDLTQFDSVDQLKQHLMESLSVSDEYATAMIGAAQTYSADLSSALDAMSVRDAFGEWLTQNAIELENASYISEAALRDFAKDADLNFEELKTSLEQSSDLGTIKVKAVFEEDGSLNGDIIQTIKDEFFGETLDLDSAYEFLIKLGLDDDQAREQLEGLINDTYDSTTDIPAAWNGETLNLTRDELTATIVAGSHNDQIDAASRISAANAANMYGEAILTAIKGAVSGVLSNLTGGLSDMLGNKLLDGVTRDAISGMQSSLNGMINNIQGTTYSPKIAGNILSGVSAAGAVPNRASAYGTSGSRESTRKGSGTGSGKGKDSTWKPDYDWLYNLEQHITEELRKQKQLQADLKDLAEDPNASGAEKLKNLQEQVKVLEAQKKYYDIEQARRADEMRAYEKEYKDVSQYVWFDWEHNAVHENTDKIDAIQDEDTYKRVEEAKKELERIEKEMEEAGEKAEDIDDQIREIQKKFHKDFIDLQNRVMDALKQSYQDEIDALSNVSNAIDKANDRLVDGINKALSKQRQNRENKKTEKNLTDIEQRIAYLSMDTSGANQKEIMDLQAQLDDERQSYTDTLIDQKVNELKDQNDQASAERQAQIDLMQAQLNYAVQNGTLWQEVYELMQKGINDNGILVENSRMTTLLKNKENWKSLSDQQKTDWANDLKTQASNAYVEMKGVKTNTGEAAIAEKTAQKEIGTKIVPATKEAGEKSSGSGGSGSVRAGIDDTRDKIEKQLKDYSKITPITTKLDDLKRAIASKTTNVHIQVGGSAKSGTYLTQYATGGLADETGPAWLDGTKSRPEYILNAAQTKGFLTLVDVLDGLKKGDYSNTNNNSTYGDFNLNINVDKMSDDFDTDNLIKKIKKELFEDASYRNFNNVTRLR